MMSPLFSVVDLMVPFGSGMLGCSELSKFSGKKRKDRFYLKVKEIKNSLHSFTLTVFGVSKVHYRAKPFCSLLVKTAKFSRQKSQE